MNRSEGGAQIECPDESRWFDVALGAEDTETAILLSEHAATCPHCGELLRNAIWVFSDDGDTGETEFIAELDTSQSKWQMQTAGDLAGRFGETRQIPPKANDSAPAKIRWFGFDWRLVGVAAGLVIGGVVWIWWPSASRSPAEPLIQVVAHDHSIPVVEKSIAKVSEVKLAEAPVLLAMTLEPGVTRGLDRPKEISLGPETRVLAATLRFVNDPPRELSFVVTDSADRTVWTGSGRLSARDLKAGTVVVNIAASVLKKDDYKLRAKGRTESGIDWIETYGWRVTR